MQPVLTSIGTLGGNSFAVLSSSASGGTIAVDCLYAFDGKTGDNGYASSANGVTYYWIEWYNPTPLKISSLRIYNANYSGALAPTGGIVQGSNDGVNWTNIKTFTNSVTAINQYWTIAVNVTGAYKYGRIYVPSANFTGNAARARFGEITINATTLEEKWIEV